MSEPSRPTVAQIEDEIRALGNAAPETAIADLTAVAQRAIIELNRVAKQQSAEHRGQPSWGQWARVANAVRSAILQVAAVRDAIKPLTSPTAASPVRSSDKPDDEVTSDRASKESR